MGIFSFLFGGKKETKSVERDYKKTNDETGYQNLIIKDIKPVINSSSIPNRETSGYCNQYLRTTDPERLYQIFNDSTKLDTTSQKEYTAQTRYELAIECYHQLISLNIGKASKKELKEIMEDVVDIFPRIYCGSHECRKC